MSLRTLERGMRVRTIDDCDLGEVADVRGDHFCVKRSDGDDVWLSDATVARRDDGCVTLEFREEQLDHYAVEGPGTAHAASPILDAEQDTFVSEEDRARRRKAMADGYPSEVAELNEFSESTERRN